MPWRFDGPQDHEGTWYRHSLLPHEQQLTPTNAAAAEPYVVSHKAKLAHLPLPGPFVERPLCAEAHGAVPSGSLRRLLLVPAPGPPPICAHCLTVLARLNRLAGHPTPQPEGTTP